MPIDIYGYGRELARTIQPRGGNPSAAALSAMLGLGQQYAGMRGQDIATRALESRKADAEKLRLEHEYGLREQEAEAQQRRHQLQRDVAAAALQRELSEAQQRHEKEIRYGGTGGAREGGRTGGGLTASEKREGEEVIAKLRGFANDASKAGNIELALKFEASAKAIEDDMKRRDEKPVEPLNVHFSGASPTMDRIMANSGIESVPWTAPGRDPQRAMRELENISAMAARMYQQGKISYADLDQITNEYNTMSGRLREVIAARAQPRKPIEMPSREWPITGALRRTGAQFAWPITYPASMIAGYAREKLTPAWEALFGKDD
jgi:hypothetical protein